MGAETAARNKKRASSRGPKPKMTKEERRKKYTDIARKRRQKQNGERRRVGNKQMVCYNCRQPGHNASECPMLKGESSVCTPVGTQTTLCYKCGSTEHALHNCPKRHRGDRTDLPFATCFICNQKGHLASACPENKTGIYVNGGSCRVCGSQQHLATDCPEKKKRKKDTETKTEDNGLEDLLEIDENPSSTVSETKKANGNKKRSSSVEPKKKKRVVNF